MSIPLPRSSTRWPRPSRSHIIEGALLALLLVQAARVVPMLPLAAPALPSTPAAPPRAAQAPSLTRWGDPFHREWAATDATGTGGYQLFGIRLAGAASSAFLGREGTQRAYRTGDEIAPGLALAAVAADHVVLRGPGGDARLAMPLRASTILTDATP